jgi:hypothetical protein
MTELSEVFKHLIAFAGETSRWAVPLIALLLLVGQFTASVSLRFTPGLMLSPASQAKNNLPSLFTKSLFPLTTGLRQIFRY